MKEELLSYGLSEKEVDFYLAVLKNGKSTAHQLSEITSLSRSTVYDIAESLKKKGLLSTHTEAKKYYFAATNPEALITRLREKEQIVQDILPQLKQLCTQPLNQPTITIYKGTTGLRTAANEMLNANKKEILVYGGGVKADEVFGSYTANFSQKRIEKKITLRTIVGKKVPQHMLKSKTKKYTPIRTLDIFENHDTTYFIYDDTVLIWSYGDELVAIKTASKTLANSQRVIFEQLWNQAKRN